jgi:hypothetical protein
MTKDIFYAILKLVSGEEIIAKVCAFIENEEVLVVLDNPIVVHIMENKNSKNPLMKMTPWVCTSESDTHIIKRSHIMTMSEIKEEYLIKVHNQYIQNKNKTSNESTITEGMGYVSSINDARVSLEKIYQANEKFKNVD